MGSTPSRGARGPAEVRLPNTGLRFSPQQLRRLNLQLARLARDAHREGEREWAAGGAAAAAVVERLVLRLVSGAGALDARFACKFLTTLDSPTHRAHAPGGCARLQYLVRLDALSQPALYPEADADAEAGAGAGAERGPGAEEGEGAVWVRVEEGGGGAGDALPQGFARARLQGPGAAQWAEFLSPQGHLRRDKVVERFVELLAQAAARAPHAGPAAPDRVDESRLCGCPGKVVDAGVLYRLLRLPPDQQLFYGAAEGERSRFPEPRDFRVAIVEGAPAVRLRVGFLGGGGGGDEGGGGGGGGGGGRRDAEVRLVLALGVAAWPRHSDFPARAPLAHPDCLLFHQAAQTGFFLVPGAPHPAVRCDERATAWAVWAPAAELALLTHYSPASTPMRALAAAEAVLLTLRAPAHAPQGVGLRVASRHLVRSLLLWALEREPSALAWAPDALAAHALGLLDALAGALRAGAHRSYFFPRLNAVLHAARGARPPVEDELLGDARLLADGLRALHAQAQTSAPAPGPAPAPAHALDADADDALPADLDDRMAASERLEAALLRKWRHVLADLAPPPTTRSRRLGFAAAAAPAGALGSNAHAVAAAAAAAAAAQYTPRQLDYIACLLREVLAVRQLTLQGSGMGAGAGAACWAGPGPLQDDPVEDLVFLLSALLEQAKEQALGEALALGGARGARARRRRDRPPVAPAAAASKGDAPARFRAAFDRAATLLIDCVRRDIDTSNANLNDDAILVRHVLKWLYRALDHDKRQLAPVLRPYLQRLFAASHEGGWHLEEWRRRRCVGAAADADEVRALGAFCRLVLAGEVSATEGVLDAEAKGWSWAEGIVQAAEFLAQRARSRSANGPADDAPGLQLVFTPAPGKVVRHCVYLPDLRGSRFPYREDNGNGGVRGSWGRGSRSAASTLKRATLRRAAATLPALVAPPTPTRPAHDHAHTAHSAHEELAVRLQRLGSCAGDLDGGGDADGASDLPHHRLRDTNPLVLAVEAQRRYGQQRGLGDVITALVALHKFSVLQEVSALLPEGERAPVLDAIQKIAREARRARARGRAATLSHPHAHAHAHAANGNGANGVAAADTAGLYRPRAELCAPPPLGPAHAAAASSSAPASPQVTLQRDASAFRAAAAADAQTLLGACRAARRRVGGGAGAGAGPYSPYGHFGPCAPAIAPRLHAHAQGPAPFGLLGEPGAHLGLGAAPALAVPLLELTEDRQLRLAPQRPMAMRPPENGSGNHAHAQAHAHALGLHQPHLQLPPAVAAAPPRRRDLVTKL